MPWYEVVALLTAGMAAGTINTIVGSGTLITFPTLLFFGIPPLVANVSNTIGLVAGGLTGIHGYRAELTGQGSVLRRLVPASVVGAVTGAILLLELPESAVRRHRADPHRRRSVAGPAGAADPGMGGHATPGP